MKPNQTKSGSGNRNRGRYNKNRRRPKKRQNSDERGPQQVKKEVVKAVPKRYGVVFYDTHQQAKEDGPALLDKAKEVDQLNIVIKAEGTMDDPDLLQYGKLYAGEAWYTIHQRRYEEGWYNEPH